MLSLQTPPSPTLPLKGGGSRLSSLHRAGTLLKSEITKPRNAPGTANRVGHRCARDKTLTLEPKQEIAGQRIFAAEQMRAAGDIEQQTVRRIEPDQRGVTVTPIGDRFQQTAIGLEIRLHHRQRRIAGPRIGQSEADLEAEPRRAIGQRRDLLRAFDRCDDDKALNPFGRAALDPVGRKSPQP
jgi:hypothetical protein